jgi:predicted alpha/beta superfamily hydrolase
MEYFFGNKESGNILIQMVGDYDLSFIDSEVEIIKDLKGDDDFYLIAFKVDNWNDDLSPWKSVPYFGEDAFAGNAETTLKKLLDYIDENVLKNRNKDEIKLYIGGYSLAALFALWSVYQTDIFSGVAAASPSMWFPGFYEYLKSNEIKTKSVYLSLGKAEKTVKRDDDRLVGDLLEELHQSYINEVECKLHWNDGGHFWKPDSRVAKAFAWNLKTDKHGMMDL